MLITLDPAATAPADATALMLPADTDGSDHQFVDAGFAFGTRTTNQLHRTTYLPPRWRRDGNRILDDLGRERVCIIEWTSALGVSYAHMHLTDLVVYLRGCVARGERPLLDPQWASRRAVLRVARDEVERISGRIGELSRKGPVHQIGVEQQHLAGFKDLAVLLGRAVDGAK